MRVLSLFDGISCGRLALHRAGIPITQYIASEIDKYAIQVSKANWSDVIHLNDVRIVRQMVEAGVFGHVDLLIGGSPYQGFSFAGKQLAFDDPRSALFFEYVHILHALRRRNPNLRFLLENVKMKKEHLAVITQFLGVIPVFINSALVSAQNRQRYYWCNWSVSQPADRGILLRDIIETGEVDREKSYCIDANYHKGGSLQNYLDKGRRQIVLSPAKLVNVNPSGNGMNGWVYGVDAKSPCLTTNKGEGTKISKRGIAGISLTENGLRPFKDDGRSGSISEIGTIGLPDTKSAAVTSTHAPKYTGGAIRGRNIVDGKRKDYPGAPTEQRLEIRDDFKAGCITTVQKDSVVVLREATERHIRNMKSLDDKSFTLLSSMHKGAQANGQTLIPDEGITYRRLTPVECERLQGVPDNYTASVSNTQRYKMLGNGWQVDTIEHIFREMCK